MGDGYGSPIRLHFEDPEAMSEAGYEDGMELQALSIALSVERKVGAMTLPYLAGQRLGIDMNRSQATIIIEGIFTDDDLSRRGTSAKSASAVIDFGLKLLDANAVGARSSYQNSELANLTNGAGTGIAAGHLNLKAQDGTTHTVDFTRIYGTTAGYRSGVEIVVENTADNSFITPADLASGVATAIATFSGTPFTTSISASAVPSAGNARLTISQSNAGAMTIQGSVEFENNNNFALYHEMFRGGRNAVNRGGKSAGDKVQDLYGILQNTGRGGVLSTALRTVVGTISTTVAVLATGGFGVTDGLIDNFTEAFGDYPIGLQIPYNSMITAPDGKKYAARNFLIPTGHVGINDKMSHTNDNAAGVKFKEDDKTTGIKGTVQKFDVSYAAAEEHYTYQMVFVPIDFLG